MSAEGEPVVCSLRDSERLRPFPMISGEEVIRRLEEELAEARQQIKDKDEKVSRLSLMQTSVDSEVQELTEKLFQEAYKMVNIAEERRERAEKLHRESKLKVDVLSAEVDALKLIVASSGVAFNHHNNTSPLHQHKLAKESPFLSKFLHSSAKKSVTPPNSLKSKSNSLPSSSLDKIEKPHVISDEQRKADEVEEIDPVYFREFSNWRECGSLLPFSSLREADSSAPASCTTLSSSTVQFLSRINEEDVRPCMNFENTQLSTDILKAIQENTLEIEPFNEPKSAIRECALSGVPRFCPYRVRVGSEQEWIRISLLARNRIAAVCDFFTYLRYLSQGMLKCGIRDSYFDVIALRKNMALARLGLGFVPKTTISRPGSGFH